MPGRSVFRLLRVRGLRNRWMVGSMAFIVLLALAAVAAYGVAIGGYYYSGVRTALETKASSSSAFFSNYVTRTYAEYYQSAYRYTGLFDERDKLDLQFISPSGRIEVSTYGLTAGTMPGTGDIADALATGELRSFMGRDPSTGERIIAVSSPLIYSDGRIMGIIRYVSSLRLVDRQVVYNILIAFGIALGLVLVMFLTNLVFIRSIVTPIGEVTAMTRRIADGGYGSQIQNKYEDEMGEMVDAINDLSIQISHSEKVKTEFISSVSHELRTPLTAITGWTETLSYDENLDAETRRKGLGIVLEEARRLTNMVEELLDFTRIEDGRFTVNIEKMDVEAELEDTLFTCRELMKQENLQLDYSPPEEPMPVIPGDPERLKQVILNLLDNAAKHGGSGGRIEVSLELQKNYQDSGKDFVTIRVRDFGPGIPPDELGNVKLKFYRGSSKARGSGIGLAVCDEIVRLHNGILDVTNAPEGGCVVSVRLPAAEG
ncbi:MAG: HAMP domain-containing histidine kinase [Oscillospiraceae bacterium]|nr:HAMP domain-containing histidine kinase [Oscillospiraceae bacterium]